MLRSGHYVTTGIASQLETLWERCGLPTRHITPYPWKWPGDSSRTCPHSIGPTIVWFQKPFIYTVCGSRLNSPPITGLNRKS